MGKSYNNNRTKRFLRSVRSVAVIVLAGTGLAACSTPSLPGLSSSSLAPASLAPVAMQASKLQPAPAMAVKPAKAVSLAMSPILGPPKSVAGKLSKRIASELKKRNINVVRGKGKYNVRGYVAASAEGKGGKLAYIWDLNNKAGKRQHRFSGEENVVAKGGDAWAGVNNKTINAIASKTAKQLAGWIAKKNGTSNRVASRSNAIPRSARAPVTTASTGSSRSNRIIMAMVAPVSGAPGDGKSSLTKAIKDKLYAKGIRLTSKRTSSVYQVRGVVQVSKAKGGQQSIRIDWRVYSPKGKRLGTVTQKNNIPQGSLNGAWGPIASAAAGAAADGITKLLPKSTRRM